tara:strand:- start:18017 stop:18733 length:717 start_codon:yes stop_codon:yes gene_type:complete
MNLSVIIPVYNEVRTINQIINKVLNVKTQYKEIIIVDDNSTDGTKKELENYKNNNLFKILHHKNNKGKGACLITAIPHLTGDYVIIQDADLEYDPEDFLNFINLVENKPEIKVIYGSRVLKRNIIQKGFIVKFRIFANYVLTTLSNILNNQNLTDAHTCYKFIDVKVMKKMNLIQNDFSICPEITTKLNHLGFEIIEIPVRYNGRNYSDGKKIRFKDAVIAFYTLIKFRFFWKQINKK